jgi:hypothetical protein
MAEDRNGDLHRRYYAYLLERVRADKYPSTDMITLIEQGMNDEERAQLIDILLEKMADQRYPSMPMLRRMARMAG